MKFVKVYIVYSYVIIPYEGATDATHGVFFNRNDAIEYCQKLAPTICDAEWKVFSKENADSYENTDFMMRATDGCYDYECLVREFDVL